MFSAFLVVSGLIIVGSVGIPMFFFELFYSPQISHVAPPVKASEKSDTKPSPSFLAGQKDLTKASTWYPKAASYKTIESGKDYYLSIPKIGIDNLFVKVGGEDLSKSLIQFSGPEPGKVGTPVIFGHSTLPLLYNPSDYKTVFTKVPNLKKGDIIFIHSDNLTFKYEVYGLEIVDPDDLSVLNQKKDDAELALITCVPPGTTFKRLIVRSKLLES